MKVMFSAGEASGDMHAAAVAAELSRSFPHVEMLGMGGAGMARAGVRMIYDIKDLGIIGVVEVVKHLPLFFRLRTLLRETMEREKPDVLVCVDYPGFNMRIAHMAKEMGIPVVYYIAPTIWAWNKSRGKAIARDVAEVASIFPFEAEAYRKAGAKVTFVGHPLADVVKPSMTREEAMNFFGANPQKKRILIMPGSRKNEVAGLLPTMLSAAAKISEAVDAEYFLPRAETISEAFLATYLADAAGISVHVTEGHTYDLMAICDVCMASSGTATLETALMNLPTVLTYRLAPLTWFLAQRLVHVKYAGLPNLLLDREVTPELLQDAVTAEGIAGVLLPWLSDESAREKNIEELSAVRQALGDGGAVRRVAELIWKTGGGV